LSLPLQYGSLVYATSSRSKPLTRLPRSKNLMVFCSPNLIGFLKLCPGWGANKGSFSILVSLPLPLSYSGSPNLNGIAQVHQGIFLALEPNLMPGSPGTFYLIDPYLPAKPSARNLLLLTPSNLGWRCKSSSSRSRHRRR